MKFNMQSSPASHNVLILGPNILLLTVFKHRQLGSSLNVRDHVSYPQETQRSLY